MPLDASSVRAVVFETDKELGGGRIEKIYQPERDEIVLSVRTENGAKRLVVSANASNPRMYITKSVKENPAEPPMFCMLMRKHLAGGRIIKISQFGFERAADIEIESRSEMGDTVKKHIICEIMGKNSNIILTGEDGKIIDAVKHVDLSQSRVRNIFPTLTYRLPPDTGRLNPLEAGETDFERAIKEAPPGKKLDKALPALIGGISPLIVREALFRAGVASYETGGQSEGDIRKTAVELKNIFEKVKKCEFSPTLIYEKDASAPMDFSSVDIFQYTGDFKTIRVGSMSEAMETFYSERDARERMRARSYALLKNVSSQLERIRKKKPLLFDTIKDAEGREKYKIAGDLITANLYRLKNGDESLICENFYDENLSETTIALDKAKSPSQNAQMYYKKYAKAKTALVEAAKQIEAAERDEEYLESVISEIERAKTPSELEEIHGELVREGIIKSGARDGKKEKKTPSRSGPEEYSYMGYEIYSGKNNVQNDYLTMKTGRAKDLWLHTKNIPGSHVLVKYKGEEFPADVIRAAAVIAATKSSGAAAPKVDVDYCPVSHVRKPNGAKPGMVVYEGYNTASVAPDKDFCEKLRVRTEKK